MRITLLIGLVCSLTIACASTTSQRKRIAIDHNVIPPRPANATYPTWEHLCVIVDRSTIASVLNDAGKQGWELVTIDAAHPTNSGFYLRGTYVCFKRPASDP